MEPLESLIVLELYYNKRKEKRGDTNQIKGMGVRRLGHMMRIWALIADLIVSIHFGYIIFVVGGLFIIVLGGALRWRFIRNFWFRAIHLTMILIVVLETIFGISCPLTDWEYELRTAAGQQNAAAESFVARLIQQIIFYDFPPIVFTIAYCVFGIAVLASWLLIPPLLPWKQKNSKAEQ